MLIPLPESLKAVLWETPALAEACLVGGCVRDALLGLSPKDLDIEVYGISFENLARELGHWGRVDLVGRSFGVVKLKLPDGVFDFSVPRRDSKVGRGHTGFQITFDPGLTMREAAARRDYTINSMLYHPRRDELIDLFGGGEDLRCKRLRHTSPAFVEDPLRVLRGMQFAGRFDLTAVPETLDICRRIVGGHTELAVERVREEWFKWASRSTVPSAGLRFLAETGWIAHYPELAALQSTSQEPEWHPEGNVFVHTCHACDALVSLPAWQQADEADRIALMLAVLCHDFGKPGTTQWRDVDGRERIVSPGHDVTGEPLAETFLRRINAPNVLIERVPLLVRHHMAHLQTVNPRSVRRLARRLAPETIHNLSVVITADAFGRPPRPRDLPEGLVRLREIASALALEDAAPKPILLGRHLLEAGLAPGKTMGVLLEEAFEAQMEGQFQDLEGARAWLRERV